jgi:hypothetical protein
MKLYVAGPMTEYRDRGWNFAEFDAATNYLRGLGHVVISPAEHDIDTGFDPANPASQELDRQQMLRWDLEELIQCDAVYMLRGWESSEGARLEHRVAQALGLKVFLQPALFGLSHNDLLDETSAPDPTHAEGEVRYTDPETGGQKGQKLAELGALPPEALLHLAEVAGYGTHKYDRGNYLKGYKWSLSFDAMERHLLQFWGGEYDDAESGLPHLAHAAWHCLALIAFYERAVGTDDRQPKRPECAL